MLGGGSQQKLGRNGLRDPPILRYGEGFKFLFPLSQALEPKDIYFFFAKLAASGHLILFGSCHLERSNSKSFFWKEMLASRLPVNYLQGRHSSLTKRTL